MPNWCTNNITITGEVEKITPIIDKLESVNKDGLLDTFYPLPEELKDTRSPSKIVSEDEYKKELQKRKEWESEPKDKRTNYPPSVSLTQDMSDELIQKYGFNNWYDWRCHNYGTKWGDCETSLEFNDGQILGRFDSPWCSPKHGIRYLSRIFRDLRFTVDFYEFGDGFMGSYSMTNGFQMQDIYLTDLFKEIKETSPE